jgi:ABC-type bacteriocin/lantibiotic exporter with double-glycine peptidase domain
VNQGLAGLRRRIFVLTGACLLRIEDNIELWQSTRSETLVGECALTRVDERMSRMKFGILVDLMERNKYLITRWRCFSSIDVE